jgi:photosystem II stability/assembly factor-like uncharacterized protein
MIRFFRACAWAIVLGLLPFANVTSGQTITIKEISPTHSESGGPDPVTNAATGGRVNHLARATDNIFYAASEYGGLFKSTDTGRTWARLDSYLPTKVSDVKVSPADPNRVVATSLYDGRMHSLAGISVSTDGGSTWSKPASANPPAGFCENSTSYDEPAAYGIGFDADNPTHVFAGTNCGLAKSTDGGLSWTFIKPAILPKAKNVYGVVVHHGGIVDTCGSAGHQRFISGSGTWSGVKASGNPLQSGECSITASPDEPSVLFATVATFIYDTDDGGNTWNKNLANPDQIGNTTFVTTNKRQGRDFDLWFGYGKLHRINCTTPAVPAPGLRCSTGPWLEVGQGAHDDMSDIIFTKQEGCPLLLSSDGGIYFNAKAQSPDCQTPEWRQPDVTTRGLWLFTFGGVNIPSSLTRESLFMGAQDNGTFASQNAGDAAPAWKNPNCCDITDMASDGSQLLFTVCCYPVSALPENRLFRANLALDNQTMITGYPPNAEIPRGGFPDVITSFGTNRFAVVTDKGIFVTQDITATHVTWDLLGSNSPIDACALWSASIPGQANSLAFYAITGCPNGSSYKLMRYKGTSAMSVWQPVPLPRGFSDVGIFAVAPNNPNRLFMSAFNSTDMHMFRSENGGLVWTPDPALDGLMSGGGKFRMVTWQYTQPTLVAFDPNNPNNLLAGAADAGIFLSRDKGASWATITNNAGDSANPVIPRPYWAYFNRKCGQYNIYVGTQGRGAWRFSYADPAGPTVSACQDRCEAPFADCQNRCVAARDACVAESGQPGKPSSEQCVQAFEACRARCGNTRDTCRQRCLDCPQ